MLSFFFEFFSCCVVFQHNVVFILKLWEMSLTLLVGFQRKTKTDTPEMCLKSGVEGQCGGWACRPDDWVANRLF